MLEQEYCDAAAKRVRDAMGVAVRAIDGRDEARRQLAEAAEAVRLLIAWGRHLEFVLRQWDVPLCRTSAGPHETWDALPAWLRREFER